MFMLGAERPLFHAIQIEEAAALPLRQRASRRQEVRRRGKEGQGQTEERG